MQKTVLVGPKHHEIPADGRHDYEGLHGKVEAGEKEDIEVVDRTPAELKVLALVERVQLSLPVYHLLV